MSCLAGRLCSSFKSRVSKSECSKPCSLISRSVFLRFASVWLPKTVTHTSLTVSTLLVSAVSKMSLNLSRFATMLKNPAYTSKFFQYSSSKNRIMQIKTYLISEIFTTAAMIKIFSYGVGMTYGQGDTPLTARNKRSRE